MNPMGFNAEQKAIYDKVRKYHSPEEQLVALHEMVRDGINEQDVARVRRWLADQVDRQTA